MDAITIWFKRASENKYHDITDYIVTDNKTLFSWSRQINNKLYDFDIKLTSLVIDSDNVTIIPDIGDSIVISENSNGIPYKVFGNNFAGIIEYLEEEYLGLTDKEDDFNIIYNLKVRNKNFSLNNLTIKTLVSDSLSNTLNTILAGVDGLGGVNPINNLPIPKFYLSCNDVQVQPLDLQGSELNVISDLLNLLGFIYYVYYSLSTDIMNNIKIQATLYVVDPLLPSVSFTNDWVDGINFTSFKDGRLDNIDYPNYDINPDLVTEEKLTYSKDVSNLKNFIKLQVFIKNLSNVNLTRYTELGVNKDTYTIGYSYDVKYVGIDYRGAVSALNISGSPVITMTLANFTAGATISDIQFYQDRMNNNQTWFNDNPTLKQVKGKMICIIYSDNISYFCQFSISGSTLTFDGTVDPTILTIPNLKNGDLFYLVNCFDVLDENLPSYPPDVNGYVIKSVNKEASTVKFTQYDAPYATMPVVIYHYPIVTNYLSNIYDANKTLLGLRERNEKIDYPITQQEEDTLLNNYLKFNQPLETLTAENSYRKNILNVGDRVKVNLRRLNKDMLVTESTGKVLSGEGIYKEKAFIVQHFTLSNYVDSITELLAQFSNQAKVVQSNSLLNTSNAIYYESWSMPEVVGGASASLPPLIDPIVQPTTNITDTGFRLNWLSSNTNTYVLQVASDNLFTNIVYSNQVTYISGGSGSPLFWDVTLSLSGTNYFRVKAIRGTDISNYSTTDTFIVQLNNFPLNYPYSIYLKFEEVSGQTFNDSSGNNNTGNGVTSLSGTPTRGGTSPHKFVTFSSTSSIKVLDATNLQMANGGTWLFRLKRNSSPSATQCIYTQISSNITSTNNRIMIKLNTDNTLDIIFFTNNLAGRYVLYVRTSALSITNGNYFDIGITYDVVNKNLVVVKDQTIVTWSLLSAVNYHTSINNVTSLSTYSLPMYLGINYDGFSNFDQHLTDELHDFAIIKGNSANFANTFLSAQQMKDIFANIV